MLLDFSQVMFHIIGGVGAAHRGDDLQPAVGQAAQGTGVTLPFVPMGLVVGGGPTAIAAAQIGP